MRKSFKDQWENHPLNIAGGLILASFVLGIATVHSFYGLTGQEVLFPSEIYERVSVATEPLSTENDALREQLSAKVAQLNQWKFAEPFYENTPADMDFLVRGLRLDDLSGAFVKIVGPTNSDVFELGISNLQKLTGDEYGVTLLGRGRVGGNIILPSAVGPVTVKRHAVLGPFNVGTHEFRLFVDEVEIGHIVVSVVRRHVDSRFKISRNIMPFGSFQFIGSLPKPVLESLSLR